MYSIKINIPNQEKFIYLSLNILILMGNLIIDNLIFIYSN